MTTLQYAQHMADERVLPLYDKPDLPEGEVWIVSRGVASREPGVYVRMASADQDMARLVETFTSWEQPA